MTGIDLLAADVGREGVEASGPGRGILFEPSAPIAAGWHRAVVAFDRVPTGTPKIYFDFGAGFDEVFSTRLSRVGSGQRHAGILKLPYPAHRVRLESGTAEDGAGIVAFRLEPLSALQVALHLTGRAWRILRRDPRGFLSRLPLYVAALRNPFFHQVQDEAGAGTSDYAGWIERHDFSPERDGPKLRAELAEIEDKYKISLILSPEKGEAESLERTVRSLVGQIHSDWELLVVTPGTIDAFATDPRIRTVDAGRDETAAAIINRALAGATGDWMAFLDAGDVLAPDALAEIALEIARHPQTRIVYSDEDEIDAAGHRRKPFFKPDFSRELFRSQNYFGRLTAYRIEDVRTVGGLRPGFEGAAEFDLALRVFERIGADAIRHVPRVLCHRDPTRRDLEGSTETARRALEGHVQRVGLAATVDPVPGTAFLRLRFDVPEPPPLVSLIIPTRDRADLLRAAVGSILEKTTYPNYEIIVVDNGSTEPETHALLEELAREERVRVVPYPAPFNYSAINNFAVAHARGDVVGLVNNDVEVISPDWLTEMVSWAVQPDVGCVGAKLYYPNGTIQHAGVLIGVGGPASHSLLGVPHDDPGYFGRARVVGNVSAVTAACLVMRRAAFAEVGGLDEQNLPVAFNDVDLCLKVRKAGYVNVWTPFAELCHAESLSRGREDSPEKFLRHFGEIRHLRAIWGPALESDPYYSPNLSRRRADWSLGE